jgi:UDP-N-acetylmuramoyl-L-alanyl-D-glutamate--2,6-diaminopimelate ligase
MGIWAARFFNHPSRRLALVGVTGTNGKTTVTYLLEAMAAAAGMATGVIGTINYRYRDRTFPAPQTTPESIDLQRLLAEMVGQETRCVVMEASSHALALERVRGLDFDGALFTNLTRDHLDFHPDMRHYFQSKSRLFTDYLRESTKPRKFAVIYGDDPSGKELLRAAPAPGVEAISYGRSPQWDVHPLEIQADLGGLRGKIRTQKGAIEFSSRLIGQPNLENILGAAGAACALGVPAAAIQEGIARVDSVPGRLERIANGLGITVLVDYAHTPDAREKMLATLRPLTAGRLIVAFGCGGDRDRGKRPLMGEIAGRLADLVVLTSDNPRSEDPVAILAEIKEGVQKTAIRKLAAANPSLLDKLEKSERAYCVEPDRHAALRLALASARPGDLVLIAGKGHEDYQILGPRRIHFDDREVAREELVQRARP